MNVAGKSKKGMGSRDHHVILMIVRLHESFNKAKCFHASSCCESNMAFRVNSLHRAINAGIRLLVRISGAQEFAL